MPFVVFAFHELKIFENFPYPDCFFSLNNWLLRKLFFEFWKIDFFWLKNSKLMKILFLWIKPFFFVFDLRNPLFPTSENVFLFAAKLLLKSFFFISLRTVTSVNSFQCSFFFWVKKNSEKLILMIWIFLIEKSELWE